MEPPIVRTLPLGVTLGAEESLYSWLQRLARRHHITLRALLPLIGFTERLSMCNYRILVEGVAPEHLRQLEQLTGLDAGALNRSVLDEFAPLGWKPLDGSRYCIPCLRSNGGLWHRRWRLAHVFACARHRCLLHVTCPRCGRPPHSQLSKFTGLTDPTRCSVHPHSTLEARSQARACAADLLDQPLHELAPEDRRLLAQQWVDERLDRLDAADTAELRDLGRLAGPLRAQLQPLELSDFDEATLAVFDGFRPPGTWNRWTRKPTAALVAAAVTATAVEALTTPDHPRLLRTVATALRLLDSHGRISAQPRTRQRLAAQLTRFSPAFGQRLLAGSDSRLDNIERLRYRTCTTNVRLPDADDTRIRGRARFLPEYFWEDWLIRFLPRAGVKADLLAAVLPQLLLIPGSPLDTDRQGTSIPRYQSDIASCLRALTSGPDASDTLQAICNLADCLDREEPPIDYERRRSTFKDVDLSAEQWKQICRTADIESGYGARNVHARRYLFQTLTGASLTNTEHLLSFEGKNDRIEYLDRFTLFLTDTVRELLHGHAASLLADAGIDEPFTWSPPAACAAGLRLPGTEPATVDADDLRHRIVDGGVTPREAAADLDVGLELVRHLLRTAPSAVSPTSKRGRAAFDERNRRAAELLTTQFLHKERVNAGKTYETIAKETSIHIWLVLHHARRLGFDAVHQAQIAIDPAWLREQVLVLNRASTDIAAELGVSDQTVRRYRRDLDITREARHGMGK